MLSEAKAIYQIARCGLICSRPLSLTYFLTMRCNARCKMCLYWKQTWGYQSAARRTMTLDQIKTFSRSMGRLLKIEISGGEPFLRDDMDAVMHTMVANCRPLMLTVSTNGSLTARIVSAVQSFCEQWPKVMLRLDVSVDAYGEGHDAIRAFPGLYERCRETVRALKDIQRECKNLSVNVTSVLSRFNKDSFAREITFVRDDLKPDHVFMMLARGDAPTKEALDVSVEEYERTFAEVMSWRDGERTRPSHLQSLGTALGDAIARLVVESARQRRQVIPCVGGVKHIMVDEGGTILPCDFLWSYLQESPSEMLASADMANLADHGYSVPKALRSAQARNVVEFIRKGMCHCTSECLLLPSLLLQPAQYPRLAMSALRRLKRDVRAGSR